MRFAIFAAMLCLNAIPRAWSEEPATPVIVELFTSEGCSSCPPADEVLIDLAKQPVDGVEIIPLAFHVDYWDRLGWTDPFSAAWATERQYAYARSFRSDRVYTPQMVVDGRVEFVGSRKWRAVEAVREAGKRDKARLDLAIEVVEDRAAISVDGADISAGILHVALTEDNLQTEVPRGENAGRTLHHAAVVRAWESRTWAGTDTIKVVLPLHAATNRQALRVVAFVQHPESAAVEAAGTAAMP